MSQPNIIYMFSDQHNGNVLHCAGDPYVRTPNLDKLAENGVRFANCYSNSPLCVPSRSSMLSGLLPSHTGIFNNTQCLPSDKATFVHNIAAEGYETVLSGRMHFVGPDQRHGFEKRLLGDITSFFLGLDFSEKRYGYLKGSAMPSRTAIEKAGKGYSSVFNFDIDVKNAACDYLENRTDERPLFMTVGFYSPHPPYVGMEDLYDYYYNILPELSPLSFEEKENLHPATQKFLELRRIGNETTEEIKRVRAAYYAMVEHMDTLIGEIIDKVENTIGLDNTVIVYASDHGDCIGEHGMYWKTNFYEGAAKVPLIYSWKNHFPENITLSGLTSLLDIAPTFIELTNCASLPDLDGESILENIQSGKDISSDRYIISQLADIKGDNPSAMIRKGNYKLVSHYGYDAVQLFDLKNDPHELLDLGTDPKHETIKAELLSILNQYWNGEKINLLLSSHKAHVQLMKNWAQKQNIKLLDEWDGGGKDCNYLIIDGKKIDS